MPMASLEAWPLKMSSRSKPQGKGAKIVFGMFLHDIPHVSEIVYRHASPDDDNALISERTNSLT